MRNKSNVRGRVAFILATVGVITLSMFTVVVPASAKAVPKLVYAWGNDEVGNLGQGTDGQHGGPSDSAVPLPVTGLVGVKAIAAGVEHTLALMKNGTVMGWGNNANGALGNGVLTEGTPQDVPVQMMLGPGVPLTGVKAISAGEDYSLALMDNGTVMAWGNNVLYGTLGNGTGLSTAYPGLIPGLSNVKAISAGQVNACVLLKNGTVMGWGSSPGNGTILSQVPVKVSNLSKVKAISSGGDGALALLKNGTVMSWGQGGLASSLVPVKVSNLSGVKAISAGYQNGMALLKNGTVMSWGNNASGVLGDGSNVNGSDVPVKVSNLSDVKAISMADSHALALLKNGTVKAWGANVVGLLGNGSDSVPVGSYVPVTVPGLSHIKRIAASNFTSPNYDFDVASR